MTFTIWFLIIAIIVIISLSMAIARAIVGPTIVSAEYKAGVMIVTYKNGKQRRYKGSGTVWHQLPMMERAGTLKESTLSDIWSYIHLYGNPYPSAHKKNNG